MRSTASRALCQSGAHAGAAQLRRHPGSAQQDTRDGELFIFWIKPPRKTSKVRAAYAGHIGARGQRCRQRPCGYVWSVLLLAVILMSVVGAAARNHVKFVVHALPPAVTGKEASLAVLLITTVS